MSSRGLRRPGELAQSAPYQRHTLGHSLSRFHERMGQTAPRRKDSTLAKSSSSQRSAQVRACPHPLSSGMARFHHARIFPNSPEEMLNSSRCAPEYRSTYTDFTKETKS